MSTCVNKSHPEFIELKNKLGLDEKIVSAIVGLWQVHNFVDTFPTETEFRAYKDQIQGENFAEMYHPYFDRLVSNLEKNWSNPEGESVKSLLRRFKSIISPESSVSTTGSEKALRQLLKLADEGIVTPEYIAEAIKELGDYLHNSQRYLEGVLKGLKSFLKADTPEGDKLRALYHAYALADNYKRQINAIFPNSTSEFAEISEIYESPAAAEFVKIKKEIDSLITSISNEYEEKGINQLVEIYYKANQANYEATKELFDENIRNWTEQAKTASPSIKKYLENKIKAEIIKRDATLLTKANIRKALLSPGDNWISLRWRSSLNHEEAGVQISADYLFNVVEDAKRDSFDEINKLGEIEKRIMASKGPLGESVDVRDHYKFLYRETVDENGNFCMVVQTEMKDQELYNEYVRLKRIYQDPSLNGSQREKAREDFENFLNEYVEREYLPEYYEYRKSLDPAIKEKVDTIQAEKSLILELLDANDIDTESLQQLRAAEQKLANLQKDYDEFGQLKPEEDLKLARALREYYERGRNFTDANGINFSVNDFYLSTANKTQYEFELQRQKTQLQEVLDSDLPEVEKEKAQERFSNWMSVYSQTVIALEFYEHRNHITKQIDSILKKYETSSIGEEFNKLFSMLQGFRDNNKVYDGTRPSQELIAKTKEVESEIEKLKHADKDERMSDADQQALSRLFQQLRDLQVTKTTEYYNDEVERQSAHIRSKLLGQKDWESDELEQAVRKQLEKSDWWENNHIYVQRRKSEGEDTWEWEPLTIWKYTRPTEYAIKLLEDQAKEKADKLEAENPAKFANRIKELRDFKVVQAEHASKVWYDYRVNPKLKNPNFKQSIVFKTVKGSFYNEKWNELTQDEKDIAKDLLTLYQNNQEGLYRRNQLRTKIPYVRRETVRELLVDTVKLRGNKFSKLGNFVYNKVNELRTLIQKKDTERTEVDDVIGDVDQLDTFGNPLDKAGQIIYFRYSTPLEKELVSYDILRSIGLYIGESIKFRSLRENQSIILATKKTLSEAKVKSNNKGETRYSYGAKTYTGMVNRLLFGQNLMDVDKRLQGVRTLYNAGLKKAGAMSIAFSYMSPVKNLMVGIINNFVKGSIYDLTLKDLSLALVEATKSVGEYITNPQAGNLPLSMQLMNHFGVIQNRDFSKLGDIKQGYISKYGNALKFPHHFREWTEWEIQCMIGYAVLSKYTVDGPNGKISAKDAFELRDGVIKLKEDIDFPEDLQRRIRKKIKHMNHHTQGVYDQLYQPEGQKYVIDRTLFFMKKWVVPMWDYNFRSDIVNHGAAIRTVGVYRALTNITLDIVKNQFRVNAVYKAASQTEKKAVKSALMLNAVIAFGVLLQMALRDCDDDSNQDLCDYANWLLRGTADEMESLHPILTPTNFTYGFIEQKSQYSASDKIIRSLSQPGFRVWDVVTDRAVHYLDPLEPYYKRTANGKINWDITDPIFAGKPAIAVLALRLSGLNQLGSTPEEAEYKARGFMYYNPKFYLGKKESRYINEERDVVPIQHRKVKKLYE